MKMLIKVAWLNIWRRPARSLLVISAIALGAWAGIFTMGFYSGLNGRRVQDKIENRLGHLQIHPAGWVDESNPQAELRNWQALQHLLDSLPEIKAWSARTLIPGTVSTPHGSSIITLVAIDPEKEQNVTAIHRQVTSGDYFTGIPKTPLLIGAKLAQKLHLDVGKSTVLDFQYPQSAFQSVKAKVTGVYKTNDSRFDQQYVFTTRKALIAQDILTASGVQEVCILLHHQEDAALVKQRLTPAATGALVRDWKEVAPELSYIHDYMQLSMSIFMAVVMIAVGFVIINTLLMAVLERSRELKMLQSVGMSRQKIFLMVELETLFIALAGGPLGALLGWLTVSHFNRAGIHVASLETGLSAFGISSSIYPVLENRYYFLISAGIAGVALLAAVYPALRAVRGTTAVGLQR
jgi:ABC-type lipoprotein release transport system permease subunit